MLPSHWMPDPEDAARRRLHAALGHTFGDESLLRDALTHRSFRNENPTLAPHDNERLEFLGDAVLGMGVAMLLAEAHPEEREGELTRRRADLVCESGLMEVAATLGIGDAMRLGRGEERSGGRTKARLLASATEAIVGAVLVDAGAEAALALVRELFEPRLHQARGRRDVKSRLQELSQATSGHTPTYEVVSTSGPDHARSFEVAVRIDQETFPSAKGRSKGEAERLAAKLALNALHAREARAAAERQLEAEQDLP